MVVFQWEENAKTQEPIRVPSTELQSASQMVAASCRRYSCIKIGKPAPVDATIKLWCLRLAGNCPPTAKTVSFHIKRLGLGEQQTAHNSNTSTQRGKHSGSMDESTPAPQQQGRNSSQLGITPAIKLLLRSNEWSPSGIVSGLKLFAYDSWNTSLENLRPCREVNVLCLAQRLCQQLAVSARCRPELSTSTSRQNKQFGRLATRNLSLSPTCCDFPTQ